MKKLRTRILMFMAAAAAAAACHPVRAEDNGNTALTKDVKILYRIYRKKTPSDAIQIIFLFYKYLVSTGWR